MLDTAAAPHKSTRRSPLLREILKGAPGKAAEWARADAERAGLWSPVALGLGAVVYFLLGFDPPWFLAPALLIATVAAGWRRPGLKTTALLAGMAFAGFAAADLRAFVVDAPAIRRDIDFAQVRGRIISIDEASNMRRLLIEVDTIEDLPKDATPERIRLSWRGKDFDAKPGEIVELRASLSPPPRPAAPGGFDFARQLYFQRIGAVGFAVSPPSIMPEAKRSLAVKAMAAIETGRVQLARRILAKAPGDSGAIVAAVVTGKRGAISEEAEAAFRDSGLAHLLSISGLHMGLATGLIFFGLRAALALIEPVALTQPIKKWAAIAAIISGFFYLLISGAQWPAQRSFLMSSIFFVAILADRRALSLRNVAIAAFIIILLNPEAVLHPGFQMSFAAVTALIAYYEWASARANPSRSFSFAARLRRYFGGIVATDMISAAATAPYSLFHFSRTANFGLAANMVSIPMMAFLVMPAAIAAIAFIPLNADGPFWRVAAAGVDIMLSVARWTMNLPGAVTVFPHWPPAALGVLTVGGLWLCLMSAPWRLAGLIAAPVAAALIAAEPHPRIYVSEEGDNAGVLFLSPDGVRVFAVFDRRKGRFDTEVWMEQAGIDTQKVKAMSLADASSCDPQGCVAEIEGRVVAISKSGLGLKDDCSRAEIVIALYPVRRRDRQGCGAMLIDRRDAWNMGAHAVFVTERGIKTINAADLRGARPWVSNSLP